MSYDLFFFRLQQGVSIDEINQYLQDHADECHHHGCDCEGDCGDECDCEGGCGDDCDGHDDDELAEKAELIGDEEPEEDEEEEDLLPEQFVDHATDDDTMRGIIFKPYLRNFSDIEQALEEGDLTKAQLRQYVSSPSLEMPENIGSLCEEVFEYAMQGGMLPLMIPYGEEIDVAGFAKDVSQMLAEKEIVENRIAVYDPQAGCVLNKDNAEAVLQESMTRAMEWVRKTMGPGNHLLFEKIIPAEILERLSPTTPVLRFSLVDAAGQTRDSADVASARQLALVMNTLPNLFEYSDFIEDPDQSIDNMPTVSQVKEWIVSYANEQGAAAEKALADFFAAQGIVEPFLADMNSVCLRFVGRLFLSAESLGGNLGMLALSCHLLQGMAGAFGEMLLEQDPTLTEHLASVDSALGKFLKYAIASGEKDCSFQIEPLWRK